MTIELTINSQIYKITSGVKPTTETLPEGCFAIGEVDGEVRIYGNDGTDIFEVAGRRKWTLAEYQALPDEIKLDPNIYHYIKIPD